jgi:1-acyl-sn-glycerol-3-phosphate acyltransferase
MVHRHAPGQALCEKCFSRCTSNASLATLADAADDGTGSNNEQAADNEPQPAEADEAVCCAVCTVEEAGWKKGVRRGAALLGGALVAFALWLRLAPPALAREQIASIVEWLGRAGFDYRVANLEALPAAGPALVYCYHGFIPLDLYFFHLAVWRHTGRLPMTLVADFVFRIPVFGYLVRLCGGQPASHEAALRQLRDGGIVILAPGGVREGMATSAEDYALRWYGKQGFAEVAARVGAPLVPMFTRNVRELFLVLGGNSDLVKRLYSLTRLPFTPFVGPMLLPLTTVLGPPLPHEPGASVSAAAERAAEALQALMLRERRPG